MCQHACGCVCSDEVLCLQDVSKESEDRGGRVLKLKCLFDIIFQINTQMFSTEWEKLTSSFYLNALTVKEAIIYTSINLNPMVLTSSLHALQPNHCHWLP